MRQSSRPAVSIIIATYNWSAALRCAVRSVLLQTVQDFELLVVGDGCTDDSADVVAAFDDRRIHWHNLAHNHGGQWAPNNFGIGIAASDYIAYLGHDDIWYPTHLASCLRTAREKSADLVAAVAVLLGPAETRERWLGGIFREGVYAPSDFIPPSAMMHRKSLIETIGPWKDPSTLVLPVDCEFLKDAFEARARIAPTNELTVFKFNAAWRRDSYLVKSVDEQEALLRKIEGGGDFRAAELIETLRAVAEGRSRFVEIPRDPKWPLGETHRRNRIFKGAEQQFSADQLRPVTARERFALDRTLSGFEWYEQEFDQRYGSFRWSGSSHISTVDVPVVIDRALVLGVHVLQVFDAGAIATLELLVDDERIETSWEMTATGTRMLTGVVRPGPGHPPDRAPRIAIKVGRMGRYCDLGISNDDRWLGIAVNWIELAPLDDAARRGWRNRLLNMLRPPTRWRAVRGARAAQEQDLASRNDAGHHDRRVRSGGPARPCEKSA